MDISSEIVINLLPLLLANVGGVRPALSGVIEGVAEATASLLKVFAGWVSDQQQTRKWLAVAGQSISALAKPFFYIANSWGLIAAVRRVGRVGKGVRTAPRAALVADSISTAQRGLAVGLERAADTAGAMGGVCIALAVVWQGQAHETVLDAGTFRSVVLLSRIPAGLAVVALAVGTHAVPVLSKKAAPALAFHSPGRPFVTFMSIVSVFEFGNSSDAFLVLRAQERGLSVSGILGRLGVFNLGSTLVSTPAGRLAARLGRRQTIIGGVAPLRGDLSGLWAGTGSMAGVGAVGRVRGVLWADVRHGESPDRRRGPGGLAWDSLWHV
jgi:MFS family permease